MTREEIIADITGRMGLIIAADIFSKMRHVCPNCGGSLWPVTPMDGTAPKMSGCTQCDKYFKGEVVELVWVGGPPEQSEAVCRPSEPEQERS